MFELTIFLSYSIRKNARMKGNSKMFAKLKTSFELTQTLKILKSHWQLISNI